MFFLSESFIISFGLEFREKFSLVILEEYGCEFYYCVESEFGYSWLFEIYMLEDGKYVALDDGQSEDLEIYLEHFFLGSKFFLFVG